MDGWQLVKKTRVPKWKRKSLIELISFPSKPDGHWHYANLLARMDEDVDQDTKKQLNDAYQMYCTIIERNNNEDYLAQFKMEHN